MKRSALWSAAFLFVLRAVWVFRFPIGDCDETFNAWEPMHYLMTGRGFKVWEYAPEFALRPIAYILAHAVPASAVAAFFPIGHVFSAMRLLLLAASSLAEGLLISAVRSHLSVGAGTVTAVVLVFSPAAVWASFSFLPTTAAGVLLTLAYAAGLSRPRSPLHIAVPAMAAAVVGWPFAGLCAAPLVPTFLRRAYDSRDGLLSWIVRAGVCAAVMVVASVVADSAFYHRFPTFAAWNLVGYNTAPQQGGGGVGGSGLYGVEPWWYFLAQLIVNYNVAGVAVLLLPIIVLGGGVKRGGLAMWTLAPLYLWLAFWVTVPHKEERFLTPVLPLVAVAAGVFASSLNRLARFLFTVVFVALAFLRLLLISSAYSAPLHAWAAASSAALRLRRDATICVGKEWHRMTPHFVSAPNPRVRIEFVKSGFSGALPREWDAENRGGFDSRNRADPRRYVDVSVCDVLVDAEYPGQVEEKIMSLPGFTPLATFPYLDRAQTSAPWRWFDLRGIPGVVGEVAKLKMTFVPYVVAVRDGAAAPQPPQEAATVAAR